MSAQNWRWWRDLGAVSAGALVAQATPIAASLVLARLVAPADYGSYAAWLGLVTVAGVLITLRLEAAIPLESEGESRQRALGAVLAVIGGLVVLLGIAAVVISLAGLVPDMAPGWIALGLASAALLAASNAFQLWLGAQGWFAELSRLRIIQALALSGSQVLGCWLWPSPVALATGYALGIATGLGYATGGPLRRSCAGVARSDRPASACAFLRRRRSFVLLAMPAGLLGTLAEQLPVLLVAARFGAEAGGHLSLAMRTMGAAIGLVVSSVTDVFRRDAASAWAARSECTAEFSRALRVLAAFAAVLLAVAAPFGEPLFAWVFGVAWRPAGTAAVWLLPVFLLRIVASPLSYMYFVAGRQGWDLAWQVALVLFTAAAFTLPASEAAALHGYAWGYAALYVVYLYAAYRLSRGRTASTT
jgi:O-antigen/teichoic acid export membrane protein